MDFNHLNNVVRTSNTIHSYFRFVLFLPFFFFFFALFLAYRMCLKICYKATYALLFNCMALLLYSGNS